MNGIYALKPAFVARLRRVEDVLVARCVSPNVLTLAAVLVSVATGAALAGGGGLQQPLLWLTVLPLCVARLALNALDGSVARRLSLSSPRGAALNELGDRACDLATFGPLIGFLPPGLVIAAIAAMTLTSTAGVMAQAVVGTRDTRGPMGKADRVLLLGFAATIAAFTDSTLPFLSALAVVIVGCIVTTTSRVARLSKEPTSVR